MKCVDGEGVECTIVQQTTLKLSERVVEPGIMCLLISGGISLRKRELSVSSGISDTHGNLLEFPVLCQRRAYMSLEQYGSIVVVCRSIRLLTFFYLLTPSPGPATHPLYMKCVWRRDLSFFF